MVKKHGGSAWQYTRKTYGGPGEQTFDPSRGNEIATHGGKNSRKRRRFGGSTKISTAGGKRRRKSRRAYSGRKSYGGQKRGGCGCSGPPVAPTTMTGGSAEPSSATSSLLTGSV